MKKDVLTEEQHTDGREKSENFYKIIAFFSLVFLNVVTQIAFKLSQKNGVYEYNTMSAMTIVEFIKLMMSFGMHYRDVGSLDEVRESFRILPSRIYVIYGIMALSYAIYNQVVFLCLSVVDPGSFSLFKSFIPIIVSLLNFVLLGNQLTEQQIYCIIIQIFGIIPVIFTSDGSGRTSLGYSVHQVTVMTGTILMASLNTIYNAMVVKKETVPVALQNIVLYMFGVAINFAMYQFVPREDSHGFFFGYNHFGVLLLLTLNSVIGIAITIIYKYGDAVLKTLTSPLASSILVFLSIFFFDMPMDIVKAAGAVVVVVDTLLYLKLPKAQDGAGERDGTLTSRCYQCYDSFKKSMRGRCCGFTLVLIGAVLVAINNIPSPQEFETALSTAKNATSEIENKLPVVLVVQNLFIERDIDTKTHADRAEKLGMLEQYAHHFQYVIVDSPSIPANKELLGGHLDLYRFACVNHALNDLDDWSNGHIDLQGVLVMHADFFLYPSFLNAARTALTDHPGVAWLPQNTNNNIGSTTFQRRQIEFVEDKFPAEGWHWGGYHQRITDAWNNLTAAGDSRRPLIPNGWSDFYFVPRRLFENFTSAAQTFRDYRVMNEMAIPNSLRYASREQDVDYCLLVNFMGGCCMDIKETRLRDPEVKVHALGGHHVDLREPGVRAAILQTWVEYESNQTTQ